MFVSDFFQSEPIAFLSFIGCFGLLIGSFLNVVIHRLGQGMLLSDISDTGLNSEISTLVTPRSACPNCHHPILFRDNVPLLSYCLLKGRCRHCEILISFRYPMVELLTAVLSMVVAIRFGFSVTTMAGLIFTYTLIALAFIDIETMLLPDNITLPTLWLGLSLSLFNILVPSTDAILGAILGYLSLWTVYWTFKLITGKEGMGYGDFKLLALLGAWCGWQALPFIVFLSSVLGVLFGLFFILFKKHNKNNPLPFGPYLAMAGFLAFLCHPDLNRLYLWILHS